MLIDGVHVNVHQVFLNISVKSNLPNLNFQRVNSGLINVNNEIRRIEQYVEKHDLLIKWFYEKEDLDMLMSGNQYSKFLKLNFKFIEY